MPWWIYFWLHQHCVRLVKQSKPNQCSVLHLPLSVAKPGLHSKFQDSQVIKRQNNNNNKICYFYFGLMSVCLSSFLCSSLHPAHSPSLIFCLYVCMYVYQTHAWCTKSPGEIIKFSVTRVIDGCGPLHGCWESNISSAVATSDLNF